MGRLSTADDLKRRLVQQAGTLELDCLGIVSLDTMPDLAERLGIFLADGRHGDMQWMADNADKRADPRVLWPQARTAIVLGYSYAPEHDPLDALDETDRAIISVYAKGRDYHDVLKSKMKVLARAFAAESGADVKVFVDTAPLMEKPLAQRAGLGWQGKHTNLVSRQQGSWLFLGVILTTADIAPDAPEVDHCGSCRRCLDICPTGAFPSPYQLDARRCIAYLTIEHKGHIDRRYRAALGNRVFGCDDCLAVCPWNKFAETTREVKFAVREATDNPPIADLLTLDDATFRTRFAGTPIKRTGRDRVVRNAVIAAGNSGNEAYLDRVDELTADASPLVRAAAIWALRRLASPERVAAVRAIREPLEPDDAVNAEWRGALTEPENT